jgi:hypothetical protein
MSCTRAACIRCQARRSRNVLASLPRTQTYVFFLVLFVTLLTYSRSHTLHRCWLARFGIFARTCCRTRRPVYCQREECSSGIWSKKMISVRNTRTKKHVTAPNYSSYWLVKFSSRMRSASRSWRGPVRSCICKYLLEASKRPTNHRKRAN